MDSVLILLSLLKVLEAVIALTIEVSRSLGLCNVAWEMLSFILVFRQNALCTINTFVRCCPKVI